MTGDWVARSAEQADRGTGLAGDSRSTGSRAAGSWDPGDPWTDDDLGATTQWARRDSGSQPQAQDGETGATTGGDARRLGDRPAALARGAGDGVPAVIERHTAARAWEPRWDSGPQQPVSATGSRPAASSGGQPRYAWDSGPQRRVAPTGSQPAVPGGDQSRDSWPSGPQRYIPSGGDQSRDSWPSGPQRSLPGPAEPAHADVPVAERSAAVRSRDRLAAGRAERRSAA